MRVELLCIVLGLGACATTEFVSTSEPVAGGRNPRPAHEVEIFFGTEPTRPYVRVGYFERAPSDYVNDNAGDVANALRRKGGYEGCDAVIVPPKEDLERLAQSTTEKAKAYCVMYSEQASPKAAADPAPIAQPAPDATRTAQPVLSTKEEPLKVSNANDTMRVSDVKNLPDSEACERGKADACIRAGIEAEQKKELDKALAFFDKACGAPNQRGCTHKGILLLQGSTGMKKDEAQALELFTKACVLDDAIACRYQGLMYVEGKGVKKSTLGGLNLLDKACTAKDGWACWRISQLYKKGEGTAKDPDKAKAYERNACDSGYAQACGN